MPMKVIRNKSSIIRSFQAFLSVKIRPDHFYWQRKTIDWNSSEASSEDPIPKKAMHISNMFLTMIDYIQSYYPSKPFQLPILYELYFCNYWLGFHRTLHYQVTWSWSNICNRVYATVIPCQLYFCLNYCSATIDLNLSKISYEVYNVFLIRENRYKSYLEIVIVLVRTAYCLL